MGDIGTIMQANNTWHIAKANYEGNVATQLANNKLEAAKVTLSEFSRTLGNQMRMDAAGKEYNYAMSQLSHELEQSGKGKLNAQLQHAEAQGALQAQAGTFGVGGASVELMDTLIDLQAATKQEEKTRAVALMAANGKKQTATIINNAQSSIDLQQSFGQFDYSRHMMPKKLKNRFLKLIGVAAATYFGGPQAGEAAAAGVVGEWKAQNGDFGGANQSFGRAMQGGMQAYQQWGERGGQSWGGAVRQKGTQTKSTNVDMGQGLNLFETSGDTGWGGWSWGG